MNSITETDKAYIAGLIDGEGCISIVKSMQPGGLTPSYRLDLKISQKSDEVLMGLRNLCGIGTVCKNGGYQHAWILGAIDSRDLLITLLPYLKIKRREAELAIEYQSKQGHHNSPGKGHSYPLYLIEEKERYFQEIHRLKGFSGQRGRPKKNPKP